MRNWGNTFVIACSALAVAAVPALVIAAETIRYRYDAQGRLIRVERSGDLNNGVVTNHVFDKADNRWKQETTGSPNSGPP
jgi:coenzyme F420-reducing hydrogenase delta subunit